LVADRRLVRSRNHKSTLRLMKKPKMLRVAPLRPSLIFAR
jgi:hypothetical protein